MRLSAASCVVCRRLRTLQRELDASFGRMLFLGERLRDVRGAQELGCVGLHCAGGLGKQYWLAGLKAMRSRPMAAASQPFSENFPRNVKMRIEITK